MGGTSLGLRRSAITAYRDAECYSPTRRDRKVTASSTRPRESRSLAASTDRSIRDRPRQLQPLGPAAGEHVEGGNDLGEVPGDDKSGQRHLFATVVNWFTTKGHPGGGVPPVDPNWDMARGSMLADNKAMNLLLTSLDEERQDDYFVTFVAARPSTRSPTCATTEELKPRLAKWATSRAGWRAHGAGRGGLFDGGQHLPVARTGALLAQVCGRGAEALGDMAVLPFFKGVLVSDGWEPYWSIEGVEHALCCVVDACTCHRLELLDRPRPG